MLVRAPQFRNHPHADVSARAWTKSAKGVPVAVSLPYTTERILGGDPRLDLITARHVLSHTTGFPNWRSKEKPLQTTRPRIAIEPGRHATLSEGCWKSPKIRAMSGRRRSSLFGGTRRILAEVYSSNSPWQSKGCHNGSENPRRGLRRIRRTVSQFRHKEIGGLNYPRQRGSFLMSRGGLS